MFNRFIPVALRNGTMKRTMSSTNSNIVNKTEAGRCVFATVVARWADRYECPIYGGQSANVVFHLRIIRCGLVS